MLLDIEDPWGKCTRCNGSDHSGHDLGCPIGISQKEKRRRSENTGAVIGIISGIIFITVLILLVINDLMIK